MPEVTFVVPTRNNAGTIGACVASCAAQADVEAGVVVIDNHSHDGTADLAAAAGADLVETAGPERSAQRNRGLAHAEAPVVVFVDSDMTVSADLARELVERFDADDRLGMVVIPELGEGHGWWNDARALEKRLYLGDASVEAGRAFRREAVTGVGGFDEALTGLEDWDLHDRVVAAGWGTGRVRAPLYHHEEPVPVAELFAEKRYYGASLPRYRERAEAPARPLSRPSLLPLLRMLPRDPRTVLCLSAMKVVEAAGIAAGAWDHHRAAGTR